MTHSAHELDPNAMLRRAGLRVTAPRVAVLKSLAAHLYLTVDHIASDVRGALGSVSTQAAYDVLRACVSAGLVRRIEPSGSSARYETRTGDNHHHLVSGSAAGSPTSTASSARRPAWNLPTLAASTWMKPRSSSGARAWIAVPQGTPWPSPDRAAHDNEEMR